MSTRDDFATLDQYIAFRNANNAAKRRWLAHHPGRVRVERARNAVRNLDKSIDRQRARQAELMALLELDESALIFVHDTCRAHIRAELQRIEAQLQETHAAHARAVTKLEEMET